MQNKGYTPEFLDKVRNASNIIEIARSYLPLRQKGQDFWACCPFHSEKTPSFAISIENVLRQHYEDVGIRLCELVHGR